MANPIVEWAHRYDIPAIGKIEGLTVDDEGLHGLVCFNDKSFDTFGWSIGQRVKAGVIRAGSVGFRVIEIEIPSKEDSKDGTSLIFRKQELLEFSICNVPANPFALAKTNEAAKTENKQELNCPTFWGDLINKFQGE
jgi:HK97 family phage prohead protease